MALSALMAGATDSHTGRDLKRRYGITEDQYNDMLAEQDGRCAICHRFRKLHVDHCHGEGHVRGLLCNGCNSGLGFFEDDAAVLALAINYLNTRTKGGP